MVQFHFAVSIGINVTLVWPLLPRYVKQTAMYHVRNTAGNYFCHCLCKHNIYQKVKTKDISSTHRKRFHIPNYFVFLRNILHNPNWSLKKIKYRDEWCSHERPCRRQFNERTSTLLALLQPETGWTAVCKDSREPFRPITIFRRNRKPKIFRFENVMETEIKKFLTFVNLSKK